MATFSIDLLTGNEYLFNGNYDVNSFSGITTANNGLTCVYPHIVRLGGDLIQNTCLNLCGYQFIISGNSDYSSFIGGVNICTCGQCFAVYGSNSSCVEKTRLTISDTQATFIDSRSIPIGIQYNADYSASYTDRSLTDKKYVDTHSGTSYSFIPSGGTKISQSGGNVTIYSMTGSTCAQDAAKLGTHLPAYYLNTGSTALCATTAGNSSCLNSKSAAYYLNTGSTAICATCAVGAKNLCGCVPASFLLSGGTAVCASCVDTDELNFSEILSYLI